MANDMINAEAFKNSRPAQAFASLPMDENLADGIGASFAIISYKGKTWALRRGKERAIFRRADKDDNSPMPYLDVVILRSPAHKSKSYYEKNSYNVDSPEAVGPPLCSSMDGVRPDNGVRAQQADACALCPRNEFRRGEDGKQRKECSDFKRLAVLIMPEMAKLAIGEPLLEPVYLPVPAASLKHLANYGQTLAGMGHHFSGVVTRITFDPEKPHPEMIFKGHKPLREEDAGAILPLRTDPLSMRITGEAGPRLALASPSTATLLPPNNIVQMKEAPKPKEIEHENAGDTAAFSAPAKPSLISSVADVPVDESDDELDSLVNGLLKKKS